MSAAPLLAWYGDDLTGSTDVMEALEGRGVPAVLFVGVPDAALAARFAGRRAVGIAGTSRSETPAWMDAHLPAAFAWLRGTGAALAHYKVCSTFDSSPAVGSIGRALEIGAAVWGQASTPVVVGAPELRRWTAFGQLFAAYRDGRYRVDRHPVMRAHPVTPMDEADLCRHLGRQTAVSVGLIDVVDLKRPLEDGAVDGVFAAHGAVVLDVLDGETQAAVGRHLWRRRGVSPFVVGSSGVEYALTAAGAGTPLCGGARAFARPGARGPIAVVSGSCSPTTARQIGWAEANGFASLAVDPVRLAAGDGAEAARAVAEGSAALGAGRSVVIHTARGAAVDLGAGGSGARLGRGLGEVLGALIDRHGLRRVVAAGGDTSSHAIAALGIGALECLWPLPGSPGSPLCRAHRADGSVLEMAFKGGQVGGDDYFGMVREG